MTADSTSSDVLRGTPVVGGVVLAPVLRVSSQLDPAALAAYVSPTDPELALADFDVAIAAVADNFKAKAQRAHGSAAEVLTASAALALDKGLRSQVRKNLNAGVGLIDSVEAAIEHFASLFAAMGGLMAERVTDLRDIALRTKAQIIGVPEPGIPTPSEPSVLVAEDLSPADSAGLDPALVVALVIEKGGATSHTAIIARQLAIPCIVGTAGVLAIDSGAVVLVDGGAGPSNSTPTQPMPNAAWPSRRVRCRHWPPGPAPRSPPMDMR